MMLCELKLQPAEGRATGMCTLQYGVEHENALGPSILSSVP